MNTRKRDSAVRNRKSPNWLQPWSQRPSVTVLLVPRTSEYVELTLVGMSSSRVATQLQFSNTGFWGKEHNNSSSLSLHTPTSHSHFTLPLQTPTSHSHFTLPLHSHFTLPLHTPTSHSHFTLPLYTPTSNPTSHSHFTPTSHSHFTLPLHTPTSHSHFKLPPHTLHAMLLLYSAKFSLIFNFVNLVNF